MASILILGGDGYLGWPTAMHFSALGYDVVVADNYFRRHSCIELDAGMLYPVENLNQRAKIWHELSGLEIKVVICDLAEPENMRDLFSGRCKYNFSVNENSINEFDAVIHYAEQPSAPFSVFDYSRADFTITNNLRVTNNLIWAVKDYSPQTHIIKLGTMGEYGTPNIDIEEGWIEIDHKGRSDKFLFPRQGGSIYHTTKVMDTDLLWWAVRMWDIRVTDLMQGPVYGLETEQTKIDPRLNTIFNYDEIFGTIINRFITQSVVGYPLTVYGQGGQTRGYLNIIDTLQCVTKAVQKPAKSGELRIYNQIMETFSVNELAEKIKEVGDSRNHSVKIKSIANPRKEAEEHYYNPTYQGMVQMGVEPNFLTTEVLHRMFEIVEKYSHNIRPDVIFKGVQWK